MGAIHWRRGETTEAVQLWRQMRVVPDDQYVGSCSAILDVLRDDRHDDGPARATRIDAILEAEHRTWVDFSFDRLARFGYGFDRF
jgi:hypothetical protein